MILRALSTYLDRAGGRDLSPWHIGEALAPVAHFWHDHGPLETTDRLDPSSGLGRRVPRGHIQQTFKGLARREGRLFALESLARFLAPPGMRRYGPAFIPHLTSLIALHARDQDLEAEAGFQLWMWERTGDFAFFRDYGRAWLRHGRLEDFAAALEAALAAPPSPALVPSFLELHTALGDWERTAELLARAHAAFPELGASGAFTLLRWRTELSLAPRPAEPPTEVASYKITLNPASPGYRWASVQFERAGLAMTPWLGVEGRRLPVALIRGLGVGPNAPTRQEADQGHLGCSLAHLSLWERFLADGRPLAFITEEDAIPYYRFDFRILEPFLHQGREVIYVNDRRSWVNLAGNIRNWAGPPPRPWLELDEVFQADYEAYGADGYVLTRRGAEKLLEAHHRDGLLDYVDAQMPAYSLKEPVTNPHWWKRRVEALRRRFDRAGRGGYLNAVCLACPWVAESGLYTSETSPWRN